MQRPDETAGETARRRFLQTAGAAAVLLGGAGGALAQDDGTETEPGTETTTETEPGTETGTEADTPTAGIGGLVSVMGGESVEATVQSMRGNIEASEAQLVTTIEHGENARRADMELRPTTLLIFGNPTTGSALMQASQTAGIDLPHKLLVWEDEEGQVWVTFNDPRYIAARHGIRGERETLDRMRQTLNTITGADLGP